MYRVWEPRQGSSRSAKREGAYAGGTIILRMLSGFLPARRGLRLRPKMLAKKQDVAPLQCGTDKVATARPAFAEATNGHRVILILLEALVMCGRGGSGRRRGGDGADRRRNRAPETISGICGTHPNAVPGASLRTMSRCRTPGFLKVAGAGSSGPESSAALPEGDRLAFSRHSRVGSARLGHNPRPARGRPPWRA